MKVIYQLKKLNIWWSILLKLKKSQKLDLKNKYFNKKVFAST